MDKNWLCILWKVQGWIDILDRDLFRHPPAVDDVRTHPVMPKLGGEALLAKFTMEVHGRAVKMHYSKAKEAKQWNEKMEHDWDLGTMHLYFKDDDFLKLDGEVQWQLPGQSGPNRADDHIEVSLKEVSGGRYRGGGKVERRKASLIKRDSKFRRNVLGAYSNYCCITGCPAMVALEAAHISPHKGSASDVVSNGLSLRRDLHAMFDKFLLGIHPDHLTVHFAPSIHESGYAEYVKLEGDQVRVRDPMLGIHKPDPRLLWEHWQEFKKSK